MTRTLLAALILLLAVADARDEKGERTSWITIAKSAESHASSMFSTSWASASAESTLPRGEATVATTAIERLSQKLSPSTSEPEAVAPGAPTPDAPEAEHAAALYVWSLTEPAAEMPPAMAETAYSVIQCESKHNTLAVGSQGERGVFQIHPIHRKRMASLGLDFDVEADRIAFAVIKWSESESFSAWSCR